MTRARRTPSVLHSAESAVARDASSVFAWMGEPYLWLAATFFAVMASLGFAQPTIHAAAMLLRWPLLTAMAVVGLGLLATRGMHRAAPAVVFLAIFLLLAAGSSLYSSTPGYSFQRGASLWLLFLATTVGWSAYCRSLREAVMATDLLWLLGLGLSMGGFLFRMGEPVGEDRFEGLFDRATGAGAYGALLLPIAIYETRHRLTGGLRIVGWISVALLYGQILLSGSRTALAIASLVSLALWFDYYGAKAVAALFVFLVAAPIPLLVSGRFTDKLKDQSERIVRPASIATFTGRLDRWKFGLEQFAERPVQGRGLGASRTLAGLKDPQRFRIEPGAVFNLHSDQIEVLVDLGLAGWLAFAAFWAALWAVGVKMLALSTGTARGLATAFLGSTAFTFIDTFMHGGFLAAGGGVSSFTWSMAALLLVVGRIVTTAHSSGPPWKAAPLASPGGPLTPAMENSRSALPATTVRLRDRRTDPKSFLPSAKDVLGPP